MSHEIVADIFTWAWFSEPHGYDFNGHLVRHAEGNLCIDPVQLTDACHVEDFRLASGLRKGQPYLGNVAAAEYSKRRFGTLGLADATAPFAIQKTPDVGQESHEFVVAPLLQAL